MLKYVFDHSQLLYLFWTMYHGFEDYLKEAKIKYSSKFNSYGNYVYKFLKIDLDGKLKFCFKNAL